MKKKVGDRGGWEKEMENDREVKAIEVNGKEQPGGQRATPVPSINVARHCTGKELLKVLLI